MKWNREQGFTLIELLIVLVISILALTAVAINLGSGTSSTELRAVVRELMSAMRYARGQALLSHQSTFVTIDLDKNSYQINTRDKVFYLPEDVEVTLVTVESELLTENRGNIRFFADGSSTGGKITLVRAEQSWPIEINWLTGKVGLQDE